jgi:hypothetical protein
MGFPSAYMPTSNEVAEDKRNPNSYKLSWEGNNCTERAGIVEGCTQYIL